MQALSIVGARPQFVKAAMVCSAIREHNRRATAPDRLRHRLIHTGQHYDRSMSDVFFDQLPLPKPDFNLDVGSGTHGSQTAAMLERIEKVLLEATPDVVIVYGDTNSTIAGALAASKLQIKVAHVEAGLRSYNRAMPEEQNRVATDHLSDLLFCPTRTSVANLKREGIDKGIVLCGDVMLDAALAFSELARRKSDLLSRLGLRASGYVLATIHRAENTDSFDRLAEIVNLLARVRYPVIFPMHPRLRNRLQETPKLQALYRALTGSRALQVIDPVSYLDMLVLQRSARLVLTDSGGVQKEAFFLQVPCVTLRHETEWVETLEGGWNRLLDAGSRNASTEVARLCAGNGALPHTRPHLRAFGDGKAAKRIVEGLVRKLHKVR